MIDYENFESNLAQVLSRVEAACSDCGRPVSSVKLLPVTKNHPVAAVEYAQRAGLLSVGENRVQEAVEKQSNYGDSGLYWELIGHLQSNKAKEAVAHFDRIQSVDSLKLLRRLDRMAEEAGKTLAILLQVNAGEDPAKFGFLVEEMDEVLDVALHLEHLKVDGLMTIAPLDDSPEVATACFDRLRELRERLSDQSGKNLQELSMGMTGDMEAAIKAGSTQIRVGTALYGTRD